MPVKGELWLDSGAVQAVRERGTSLFSAGIIRVRGDFCAQDAVRLCDASGSEFARGLCNYSFSEVSRIKVRRAPHLLCLQACSLCIWALLRFGLFKVWVLHG